MPTVDVSWNFVIRNPNKCSRLRQRVAFQQVSTEHICHIVIVKQTHVTITNTQVMLIAQALHILFTLISTCDCHCISLDAQWFIFNSIFWIGMFCSSHKCTLCRIFMSILSTYLNPDITDIPIIPWSMSSCCQFVPITIVSMFIYPSLSLSLPSGQMCSLGSDSVECCQGASEAQKCGPGARPMCGVGQAG